MSAVIVAAVVARLQAQGLAGGAHDTIPTSPAYPYVLVYADGGIRSSDREADVRVQKAQGWQTTTVGRTATQTRAALGRVVDALEGWTPTPAGWSCTVVDHDDTQPILADQSLPSDVVFYAVDQWSTIADPA